jgi:predicted signal transduction protein with EAL and GGDEF domain
MTGPLAAAARKGKIYRFFIQAPLPGFWRGTADKMASMFSKARAGMKRSGDEDFIIIGIAVATLLVMAAVGNYYFEHLRAWLVDLTSSNSSLVVCLLSLNIALTIYGWRKFRDARHEVAERTAAELRAQSLASTDPLTGFLNRRSLAEAVGGLLAVAAKRQKAVAMLIVDLDGFKTINDVHGTLPATMLRMTAE